MQQNAQPVDRHTALLREFLRTARAVVQPTEYVDMQAGEKRFGRHETESKAGYFFGRFYWFNWQGSLRA